LERHTPQNAVLARMSYLITLIVRSPVRIILPFSRQRELGRRIYQELEDGLLDDRLGRFGLHAGQPPTGDRHSPAGAKSAIGDFESGGGLLALELGASH